MITTTRVRVLGYSPLPLNASPPAGISKRNSFSAKPRSLGWLAFVSSVLLSVGILFAPMAGYAATSPVGATAGSFAVSPSGAATYSIPIVVPPGINGMAPSLSLNYNSQGGNGLVGMGWSIGGLSVIHRCGATIAIDGFKGGVNYEANDRFCLDGERLIWSATDSSYHTQHESWQKAVASDSTTNPAYFTVTDKNGTARTYGAYLGTSDAQILAMGKSVVRVWALKRIQDTSGNYLTINYQNNGYSAGEYYPVSIAYTGNGAASLNNYVLFDYPTTARTDVIQGYEGGSQISTTKFLTGIRSCTDSSCTQGSTLVRKYTLAYDNSDAFKRSRLMSVQECGADGVCLPSSTFEWQNLLIGLQNWMWTNGQGVGDSGWAMADLFGDGRQVYYTHDGNGTHYATRLNPDGTVQNWRWTGGQGMGGSGWQMADLFGDGRQVYYTKGTGGTHYATRLNPDGTLQNWMWTNGQGVGSGGWQMANLFGDGRYVYYTKGDSGIHYATQFSSLKSDLLTSVTNGLGVKTTVTYKPLTDSTVYTKDAVPYSCSAPYACYDIQDATYVVSQFSQPDGIGGTNTASYFYDGLKKHHKADTSLGFRWIQVTDPAGLVTWTTYNQSVYSGDFSLDGTEGTVYSNATYNGSQMLKSVTNTWTPHTLQTDTAGRIQRTLATLSTVYEQANDLNGSAFPSVTTTYTYSNDGYYNPQTIVASTTDGFTKTTSNTYNNASYIGQLLTSQVQAQAPGQPMLTRNSSFTYDSANRLASEIIEPGSAMWLTSTYAYDSFGNRVKKTVTGADITARDEYTLLYYGNGQYPYTKTNKPY